ncbi:MAG: o-succinylbenzoate synthase [Bacteroidales bacterium]|nr:o-succinylbenzoate synthase [Bacteroidales bacterium]MCF8397203.1 o-succinylbenzoate synthase [Bacteroidales bacterium]
MQASFKKYNLKFIRPAGTSRGVMHDRDVWFLMLKDRDGRHTGIGEIAPLKNLSCDDRPGLEEKIREVCENIQDFQYWIEEGLKDFPSILFGLETALLDVRAEKSKILFPSEFTGGNVGIPINGLIWMGKVDFMKQQIRKKIDQGFRCIKLKIGAIDFDTEVDLIKMIRKEFAADELEVRVDANGAFSPEEASGKLERLAALQVHSIEQPIRQGQLDAMEKLCRNTPVPIALDEELIGINRVEEKKELLENTKPQYIILKPSLHGGIRGCKEWIDLAEKLEIGWWNTSALESNIGLNAIAQWTYSLGVDMPQGLGTGQLFSNNIPSPLEIRNAELFYNMQKKWDLMNIR